jgi:membrane protease YdiL (CAAX protease family)
MADIHIPTVAPRRVEDFQWTPAANQPLSQERTFTLVLALGIALIVPQLCWVTPWGWLTSSLPVHGLPSGVAQEVHGRIWGFALQIFSVCLLIVVYLSGEHQFSARFAVRPIHGGGVVAAVLVPLMYVVAYIGLPQSLPLNPDPQFLIWQTNFAWLPALSELAIAPILEELLFRGFLFRVLSRTFLGPFYAALLSSLAFGVGHVDKGPDGQLICFVHGLLLCYVVQRTRTVLYGVIAHYVFNGYIGLVILVAAMAR